MKFLIDSCISNFAVKALREQGFDVLWIPETGPDPGDEAIIQQSAESGRILVTADKDFGELVFVFGKPHSTIIRLVEIPAREQGKLLLRLIETHRETIGQNALITVDRHRVRIRLVA